MNLIAVVGRIALAAIFVFSGIMKLIDIPATTAAIASKVVLPEGAAELTGQLETMSGMTIPHLLAILVGAVELLAGIFIAFNVRARFGAVALIIFTIVATFYFHDFWNQTGAPRTNNLIQTMKNLSIIGGLLLVIAMGRPRSDKSYDRSDKIYD